MGLTDKQWFTELQLSEGDFSSCPEGSDELAWALDNNVINEDKYTQWASNHYLLPEVKPEFFSMAVDQHLCEKYQDIYSWSEDFFPIYEWESILYISCIEPQKWTNAKEVCQVLAPRSAMKLLWNKITPEEIAPVTPPPVAEDISVAPEAELPSVLDFPDSEAVAVLHNEEPMPPPPVPTGSDVDVSTTQAMTETTSNLDFSALGDVSIPKMPLEKQKPSVPPTPLNSEETLQGLSFGNLDATNENSAPAPIDDDATPLPDIPLAEVAQTIAPPPVPTIENAPSVTTQPKTPQVSAVKPPPPPAINLEEPQEVSTPPNPQTTESPAPPADVANATVPDENLIQASDLLKAKELGKCNNITDVVTHIFSHIHKDFEKLMWVSKKKDKIFQPNLVYGNWVMESSAWSTPVEVIKPNIFRIAWNSRMPFHGTVSNNTTNQSYFDLWNDGNTPDHITIFPLLTGVNQCEGFIVGCGHGDEFDNHRSYKKLENLLSLSHKQLTDKKAG